MIPSRGDAGKINEMTRNDNKDDKGPELAEKAEKVGLVADKMIEKSKEIEEGTGNILTDILGTIPEEINVSEWLKSASMLGK